ncbi:MAG: SGNH/GDSL hydrolase family protein [Lachnospiraceae bacterium]|nr:SGNH/GDSL hydrolase family protein [Lachnospiraceae bacterium]
MKKAIKWIVTAAVVILILWCLQRLVMPKYAKGIVEGAFIAEYYKDRPDHDVIFVGDCEVYENFTPVLLWQEYGINSYIRGSSQQTVWQSYYLVEDTFRHEKPDVVIFNVLSMEFDKPEDGGSNMEAYNRMTLEGMRWSPSKVKDIKASMVKGEKFLDYVFPILRYHSRITELTADDFKYCFKTEKVSHNGYYLRVDVKPAVNVPGGRILSDYSFGENAYAYLDRMTELCKENNVELILIKAPSLYPYWYPEWDAQMEEYAEKHGLEYINFLGLKEECGLDYSTDTYDAGLHLNLSGAEKTTRWLGDFLTGKKGLTDRRNDEKLSAEWKQKIEFYENAIEEQKKKYGITDITGVYRKDEENS